MALTVKARAAGPDVAGPCRPWGETATPTFDFYLEDDRSAVAILSFAEAPDLAAARAYANGLLAQSRHHRAVSVCDGYTPLFIVSRSEDDGPTLRLVEPSDQR